MCIYIYVYVYIYIYLSYLIFSNVKELLGFNSDLLRAERSGLSIPVGARDCLFSKTA
jgi:hypothetical protein